jgi:hypothetical protein
VVLARNYFRTRHRLLLWSALFFAFFAASNLVLFLDLVVFPDIDMYVFRTGLTMVGAAILLFGLIWETV